MCALLRPKGYTWNPPVGQILLLLPSVSLASHFSDTACPRKKMAPELTSILFSTKGCGSKDEHFSK